MKKILFAVILCSFFNVVLAEEVVDTLVSTPIDNMYYVATGKSDSFAYQYKEYDIGGKISYCIEPGVFIKTNSYYGSEDYSVSNLGIGVTNKMELYAFYGDGYRDHDGARYRAATQKLIWSVLGTYEVEFYTGPNGAGEKIDLSYELAQIEALVANHGVFPSIITSGINMPSNSELILTDTNNVLNNFNLEITGNIDAKIEGNNLILNSSSAGNSGIRLVDKNLITEKVLFYYNADSQKMIARGNVLSTGASFNVKTYSTNFKLLKTGDVKNIIDGELVIEKANLEGIEFTLYAAENIYDFAGNLVYAKDEIIKVTNTSHEGLIEMNNLFYGKYYIVETKTLPGYILDEDKHYFVFSVDNENISIELHNELLVGDVLINKKGESINFVNNELLLSNIELEGVEFSLYSDENIYDSEGNIVIFKDQLLNKYITASDGLIVISDLLYGKYYIVETKTLPGYIIDSTKYYFSISDENQLIEYDFKNELIKGTLTITKTDLLTSIPLAGVKFGIYNSFDELIYENETNQDGIFTFLGLPVGDYYVREISTLDKYILSTDKYIFNINSYNKDVSFGITNEKIVEIPNTLLNDYSVTISISFIIFSMIGLYYGKRELF